jgi:ribosome-associated protein
VTRVPAHEIRFRTSRAGGPGGQNVNKVETRVELLWDLDGSGAFSPEQKEKLRASLGRRLGSDGIVRVVSQRFRSQSRNREAAAERLQDVVARTLTPRATRRPTRPTAASKGARLESKRRRATLKRERALERDPDA